LVSHLGEEQNNPQSFEELVGGLDYPMFIATTRSGGEMAGCLVGFATQCSIDPPRFLVCLSEKNRTCRLARAADALAVHFVPSSAQELAELFGGETGDEVDKFACCEWREGPRGLPILAGCDNWFAGAILARHDLGDHVGFLLEPIAANAGIPFEEFTFHRARRIEPGHDA
jgi:flavin reductase (DIM6/NTAB) family NADH-FMN oxidoreductase RutF